MAYIGKQPAPAALTSSDITDGIVTTAKIADGTIATADIADGAVTSAKATGVGGLALISSTDVTEVSSITIDAFSSSYANYKIILGGIGVATTNQDMKFTLLQSDDTELTTGYYWSLDSHTNGTERNETGLNEAAARYASNIHNSEDTIVADLLITNPQISGKKTCGTGVISTRFTGTTHPNPQNLSLWIDSTTSFTKIKFKTASGNFRAGGKILIYGVIQ